MKDRELIRAVNLSKNYTVRKGFFRKGTFAAVANASFSLHQGETLALIGESGSGKSTVGKMILGLTVPSGGEVFYRGEAVGSFRQDKLRAYRKAVQAVFQDPHSSLNPRMRIGDIVTEPLRNFAYSGDTGQVIRELLDMVGLGPEFAGRYPHQCSGGQKQRIAIARALAIRPEAIVLDEPLSALDITVQTQILALLRKLKDNYGMSYLLITHDLRTVKAIADRVVVMYRGRVVEAAGKQDFVSNPVHPYSRALQDAIPQLVVYK